MKKTIIFAVTLAICSFCIAQEDAQRSVTLSYGYIGGDVVPGMRPTNRVDILSGSSIFVDANLWNLNRWMSFGGYVGCGEASFAEIDNNSNEIIQFFPSLRFGVGLHMHLLSLANINTKYWDISINGNLGTYWSRHITPQTEYGLSLSVAFYPTKHIGLSLENCWGSYLFNKYNETIILHGNNLLKAGINFRF